MHSPVKYGPFGFRTRWAVAGGVAAVLFVLLGWFFLTRTSPRSSLRCQRPEAGEGTCVVGGRRAPGLRFDVERLARARLQCTKNSCWNVALDDATGANVTSVGPTTRQAAEDAVRRIESFVGDRAQRDLALELPRPGDHYFIGGALTLAALLWALASLAKVLSAATKFLVEVDPASQQLRIHRYWLSIPLGTHSVSTEAATSVDVEQGLLDPLVAKLAKGVAPRVGWRVVLFGGAHEHRPLTRRAYGRHEEHVRLAQHLRQRLGLP